MDTFDFKIDLDTFERVIDDPKAIAHFNSKQGPAFRKLFAKYEAAINGMKVFEPMPQGKLIRAAQMTFHDNGEVKPPSNRSKQPRPMKTQFNIDLKVWTREGKIDFSTRGKGQVNWQARAYLWPEAEAVTYAEHIKSQKSIGQATLDQLQATIGYFQTNQPTNHQRFYSVPVYRRPKIAGGGLKWFDQTFVMATISEGVPQEVILCHPEDGCIVETSAFSELQATGEDFSALRERLVASGKDDPNFTHQARIDFTRDREFADWATHCLHNG